MDEDTKVVKRLCEVILAQNRAVYDLEHLSELVGTTKEKILYLILKYQNSDPNRVSRNLFFSDYNPISDKDTTSLSINLTCLGEHVVKQMDLEYFNECLESINK